MKAYEALVSLTLAIEQIEEHPRLPISLDEQQVESLTNNVAFLQKFLEGYNSLVGTSQEADRLEIRIANAASAAQVAIESYIVHVIQRALSTAIHDQVVDSDEEMDFGEENNSDKEMGSCEEETSSDEEPDSGEEMSSGEQFVPDIAADLVALKIPRDEEERCRQDLEQVIREMDLIKTQVMEIVQKKENVSVQNTLRSDKVVKRIAKLRIGICYDERAGFKESSYYDLKNVELVQKLESLDCEINSGKFLKKLDLQKLSLKKLSLEADGMQWEAKLNEIASLPLLEELQLYFGYFMEPTWTTVEGQFRSLKFLKLFGCGGLKYWKVRSSHFPSLEKLVLANLHDLNEIPLDIGKLPRLKSIWLGNCTGSAVRSAKIIAEASSGETSLQVRVKLWERNEELENLASGNFHVEVI